MQKSLRLFSLPLITYSFINSYFTVFVCYAATEFLTKKIGTFARFFVRFLLCSIKNESPWATFEHLWCFATFAPFSQRNFD